MDKIVLILFCGVGAYIFAFGIIFMITATLGLTKVFNSIITNRPLLMFISVNAIVMLFTLLYMVFIEEYGSALIFLMLFIVSLIWSRCELHN